MKKPISILLVENDEDDYILLKSFLEDIENFQFTLDWKSDYISGLELMKRNNHDLIILDYLLGPQTGVELLKEAIEAGCQKPIILLTGKGSHRVDVDAMEAGAADFLVKSEINGEKLERSFRYTLERHEFLQALKESEEKYRNIFESSRDMIYITTDEGEFIDVNEGGHRILGYTKSELLQIPAAELYVNKEDRKDFIYKLRKTGLVSNYELVLKSKSGERKYCLVSASLQWIESGKFNIFGIVHDITRRRQIERDLLVAEKLAVTGRVSQMLAHEIRNPLTAINLTLSQFSYELDDKRFEQYFEMIKRNCKQINTLLSELLHSSNPVDIELHPHKIDKLIDDTIELVQDRLILKKVKLIKNLSDDICEIIVDESKIKTAFLNIMINAIEAVPENTGVITISTHKKEDKCYIEVVDNGVGIAPEYLSRLYEPYFTKKVGGIGLGLATTHKIIQSHGGTIEVESELEKGTKFSIILDL